MNDARIDLVARGLAIAGPRRQLLGGLSGALLGLLGAGAMAGPAPCPRPLVECGRRCVRVEKNRKHCGGCRIRCDKGEICRKWRCRPRNQR